MNSAQFFALLWWKMNTLKTRFDYAFALPQCTAPGWQTQIFVPVICLFSKPSPFLCYLPSDGSDLDTVSHGSLDSANDSAERTSIDTDFTKMDSSDDGFSTGRIPQLCFFQLISALRLLLFAPAFLWKRFYLNFMSFTSLRTPLCINHYIAIFSKCYCPPPPISLWTFGFHPLNGICRIKCIGQIPRNASKQCPPASRKKCHSHSRKRS